MPGERTGGRTVLGGIINSIGDRFAGTRQREQHKPRCGHIEKVYTVNGDPTTYVIVKWDVGLHADGSLSGPLPLEDPAGQIALHPGNDGAINTQKPYCEVTYTGISSNAGRVKIKDDPSGGTEAVVAANTLDGKMASFATPGSQSVV